MSHDHTTWIDRQRAAGMERGNVFDEILAAAKAHRMGDRHAREARLDERIARVQGMRQAAARFDATITPRSPELQTFPQMVERWKTGAQS